MSNRRQSRHTPQRRERNTSAKPPAEVAVPANILDVLFRAVYRLPKLLRIVLLTLMTLGTLTYALIELVPEDLRTDIITWAWSSTAVDQGERGRVAPSNGPTNPTTPAESVTPAADGAAGDVAARPAFLNYIATAREWQRFRRDAEASRAYLDAVDHMPASARTDVVRGIRLQAAIDAYRRESFYEATRLFDQAFTDVNVHPVH